MLIKKEERGKRKNEMETRNNVTERVFVGRGTVELRERTRSYALRIIKLYSSLPKTTLAQVMGKQILRSGTSVGAQYREANRAKSDADFVSKLEGALQELDESAYWLELLEDAQIVEAQRLQNLTEETAQLLKVLVTIVDRVKHRTNSK